MLSTFESSHREKQKEPRLGTSSPRPHPVHRGANGAAMPTNENDQDGHFFSDHPERRRRRGGFAAV